MSRHHKCAAILVALLAGFLTVRATGANGADNEIAVTSIAIRVLNMNEMMAFYGEAFGVEFEEVDTFGVASQFGDIAGLTLKLVPIREAVDFSGYPEVQFGVTVPDVDAVIAAAIRHGGRREGESLKNDGVTHTAVRDPDGNTIELYGRD